MNQQEFLDWIRAEYDIEPDYPWLDSPDSAVLRHPETRKWFAVILSVPRCRLGLEGETPVPVVNLKCSPVLIGSLLMAPGFVPAYHMNKKNWISVLLDGSVSAGELAHLAALSYDLTRPARRSSRPGAVRP